MFKSLKKLGSQTLGVVPLSLGLQQNGIDLIFMGNAVKPDGELMRFQPQLTRAAVIIGFGCQLECI